MASLKHILPRDSPPFGNDESFGPSMGSLVFVFFALVLVSASLTLALIYLRRKRIARQRQNQSLLPSYQHFSHRRSASMTNIPTIGRNDSVFVYDEKMNLIANSSSPPSSTVPEIRLTFPDEDGQQQKGRVVVVHVTDTGSIGMAPLSQDSLPPYQRTDADHFQSLDLERIGGLREKMPRTQRSN